MTDVYKAIIALAEVIGDKKALDEAASVLKKAYKLSDAELATRNEYNDLLTSTTKAAKELATKQAKFDMQVKEHNDAAFSLTAEKEAFAKEVKDTNILIESEKSKLDFKDRDLTARENQIASTEASLNKKQGDISKREDSVTKREEAVTERERIVLNVANAIGG